MYARNVAVGCNVSPVTTSISPLIEFMLILLLPTLCTLEPLIMVHTRVACVALAPMKLFNILELSQIVARTGSRALPVPDTSDTVVTMMPRTVYGRLRP